jgi:hypothetical protein
MPHITNHARNNGANKERIIEPKKIISLRSVKKTSLDNCEEVLHV